MFPDSKIASKMELGKEIIGPNIQCRDATKRLTEALQCRF